MGRAGAGREAFGESCSGKAIVRDQAVADGSVAAPSARQLVELSEVWTARYKKGRRSSRPARLGPEPGARSLHDRLVRHFLHLLLLAAAPRPWICSTGRLFLLEHLLAVEPLHLLVLAELLGRHLRLLARRELLFARVLGDAAARRGRSARPRPPPRRSAPASSARSVSGTALLPAKISWRPCSSYHLVSVAVMCIFSMMFRQPMPVL